MSRAVEVAFLEEQSVQLEIEFWTQLAAGELLEPGTPTWEVFRDLQGIQKALQEVAPHSPFIVGAAWDRLVEEAHRDNPGT